MRGFRAMTCRFVPRVNPRSMVNVHVRVDVPSPHLGLSMKAVKSSRPV